MVEQPIRNRQAASSTLALGSKICWSNPESIANDVPDADWGKVPVDLSKNLDHYLYGGQKTS